MAIGSLPPSPHSELSSPNWGGENGSVIDRDQYAASDVAPLPQRAGAVPSGLPEHKRRVTLGAGSPGIADAPELWIEVVLSHRTLAKRDMPCLAPTSCLNQSASRLLHSEVMPVDEELRPRPDCALGHASLRPELAQELGAGP